MKVWFTRLHLFVKAKKSLWIPKPTNYLHSYLHGKLSYSTFQSSDVFLNTKNLHFEIQQGTQQKSNALFYSGSLKPNYCSKYTVDLVTNDIFFKMAENKYLTGYAKLGTSSCKKCKQKIEKGALRIAKLVSNPFSEDAGDMKQWFHPDCIFETFIRARATTKKIEEPDDLEGFADLEQDDKDSILKLIKDFHARSGSPGKKKTPAKTTPAKVKPATSTTPIKLEPMPGSSSAKETDIRSSSNGSGLVNTSGGKDDSFREFRRLCADIAEENSYTGKTAIVKKFITKGANGGQFYA